MADPIQSLCEQGQRALLATDYLAAERYFRAAEGLAWDAADYDALARLYMPLQEARRQRRQWSGDGAFATYVARSADDTIDAAAWADRVPRGQVIVAGFGSFLPAARLRAIAGARGLYLDVPLAAAYVVEGVTMVVVAATTEVVLPPPAAVDTIDTLLRHAPPHTVMLPARSLPPDRPHGDASTFGYMMSLWEALHGPFLATADATTDPHQKLLGYRRTLRVDYACEFAHQRFSDTARQLSRQK